MFDLWSLIDYLTSNSDSDSDRVQSETETETQWKLGTKNKNRREGLAGGKIQNPATALNCRAQYPGTNNK